MRHIYLLGFMGAGKTSLGRALSSHLSFELLDTDAVIAQAQQQNISSIFETQGEAAFRQLEGVLLKSLVKRKDDLIISTGGGMPCFHNHMALINNNGISIYLQANPQQLFYQLRHQMDQRPLLKHLSTKELMTFLTGKLAEREDIYAQASFIYHLNPRLTLTQQSTQFIDFVNEHVLPAFEK